MCDDKMLLFVFKPFLGELLKKLLRGEKKQESVYDFTCRCGAAWNLYKR